MNIPRIIPVIAIAVVSTVGMAEELHAEVAAEWRFNGDADLPGGSELKLDAVAEKEPAKMAPAISKLQAASTLVAGPTGISDKWPDFLAKGFMEVGTGSGDRQANQHGLVTQGDYGTYLGGGSLESAPLGFTIYLVVQPNSAWGPGGRRGLYGVGDWMGRTPSTGNIRLTINEQKLQFTVGKGEIGAGYDLNGDGDMKDFIAAETTVSQAWDPTKWYFIAASATEGAAPVLLVRELGDEGPAASPAAATGTPTPAGADFFAVVPMELRFKEHEPMAIGASWISFGSNPQTQDGAEAKIAYTRIDNTFTSAAEMDRVFANLGERPAPGVKTAPTAQAKQPRTTMEEFKAKKWEITQRGRELDLSQFKQTFNDDFKTMSVTNDETGAGPWFAPGHTDFGAGTFVAPGPNETFTIVEDGLRIRADKDEKGKWRTGNIQTVNRKGEGFAQKYGYFEMTVKLPKGKGSWIGLWLLSQNGYLDKSQTRTEIDIIEWYGGDPSGHHPTVHLWPANGRFRATDATITKHVGLSGFKQGVGHKFFKDMLVDNHLEGFHSYGGEITPEWVIIYFDRKEIGRVPTVEEFKTPLYLVITLALFEKEIDKAVPPIDLIVKNASAYQPKAGYPGE